MQKRWNNMPLRFQLGIAITLVISTLLVGFGMLIYSGVASYLRDQASRQLRAQSSAVIGAVWTNAQPAKRPRTDVTAPREREQLTTLANALSSPTNSAVVYTADGETLATGVGVQQNQQTPAAPERDESAFLRAANGETVETILATANERQLTLYEPIVQGENVVAVAQVATSLQASDDLLRQLLFLLTTGTALGIAAALFLVVGIVRTVLRPLNSLLAASRRVADGDLAARSGLANKSEIGRLGAAFDHMVAQVQSSFAAQRRFVADAAHELRTPLTALGGQTELLLMGAASEPERQRRVFQRINGELERMARLVNDLLTLSRLDSQTTLVYQRVNLAELVSELAEEASSLAAERTCTFCAEQPVWVRGDPDRLRQVLLNLFDNAIKYTPPGGAISIIVRQERERALLAVSDTGIGIQAEDISKVWDRFFRVDQARTRATGGSGLGLAIVKGIVEAHAGSVAMTSKAGNGTTVIITLPAISAA